MVMRSMGIRRTFAAIGILALTAMPSKLLVAQQARPAAATIGDFAVSDAQKIGANSVRFSAAQMSRTAPVVVLFGASTPSWHKARAGLRQAVSQGYKISGVIMGPVDQPASMEIYAKGHHVTNPINLNEISQAEITRLVRDVCREYYAR
ncbi:hypothetical protein [Sphingobium sp. MK2]|uniref:hypothetical protein n=1 Tax=Sphingobium sp. MK2 TaxID=3116540 RepID=UPI0032E36596